MTTKNENKKLWSDAKRLNEICELWSETKRLNEVCEGIVFMEMWDMLQSMELTLAYDNVQPYTIKIKVPAKNAPNMHTTSFYDYIKQCAHAELDINLAKERAFIGEAPTPELSNDQSLIGDTPVEPTE